jgi:hypothetical protein
MNITRILFFLTIPMLALNYSCGDSDDSDSTVIIEREEDSDPENEGSSECLSATQRQNIRTFLNRLSTVPAINGTAVYRNLNADGSVTITNFNQATYTFTKVNNNLWNVSGGLCSETICQDTFSTLALRDGCFYYDEDLARINSSSNSRINITTSEVVNGVVGRTDSVASLSSGIVRISENSLLNGVLVQTSRFVSSRISTSGGSGGGTTGGGTTGGGTTGGGTTGGGTTGGGTTGGGTTGGGTTGGGTTGGGTTGGETTGGETTGGGTTGG